MRVAAVQFSATTDVDANVARIEDLVGQAAAAGAEFVVLPEASMHDFGPIDLDLGRAAQPIDGPFVTAMGKLAASHRLTLAAGMFETSDDPGRPYNTLAVLGPDGALRGSYRKAHLYDSFGYQESGRLAAGDTSPVTVDLGELTVGLMTCYDVRFPEFARLLIESGANLLIVPAAWMGGPLKEDHWETLLRARAIENTSYVIGAGQTGRMYAGYSMIIDPAGVTIARIGDQEGIVVADATSERLADVRLRNPSLANRRLGAVR